jgi:hypothetical protein
VELETFQDKRLLYVQLDSNKVCENVLVSDEGLCCIGLRSKVVQKPVTVSRTVRRPQQGPGEWMFSGVFA